MRKEKRFILGGSFETIDMNNNPCIIDIPLCRCKSQEEPLISPYLDLFSVWAEEKANSEIVLVVYKGHKPVDTIYWDDTEKYSCGNMPKNKTLFMNMFSNFDENDGFVPFQLEYIANWIEEA